MRGLKVRSADTLNDWSVALANNLVASGIREYVDLQVATAMPLAGGTFTGPVILAADAINLLSPTSLQQVNSLISTAVNTLVGTAPGVLDTLQELSAALGDNPSAITDLTTLINGKASLTGATFTGPVVVPSNTSQTNATLTLGDVQTLIGEIPAATGYTFSSNFSTTGTSTVTVQLSTTGVVAGTYSKVIVDAYGRVTEGLDLVVGDLPLVVPDAGAAFAGSSITITAALNALQDAMAAASGAANGAEDTTTSEGSTTFFGFTNVVGSQAVAKPYRLIVFIDGIRQPRSSYTVAATGITFSTAPVNNAEVEILQIS
jgi:hypothetical protein